MQWQKMSISTHQKSTYGILLFIFLNIDDRELLLKFRSNLKSTQAEISLEQFHETLFID